MKIKFSPITQEDIEKFEVPSVLEGRMRMDATDEAGNTSYTYVPEEMIQRLGVEYIENHCTLEYSDVFEEWFLRVSEEDFYNDTDRNPPKTIQVKFVELKPGEDTEVWQNIATGSYYLRQLCREPFARWLTADKRMYGFEDRNLLRPNITIQNVANGQTERVYYKDWNETAAYHDTFNPKFRTET